MRFILFNIVILGALGYLFVAEKGDGVDIWSILDPGDPRFGEEQRTPPVAYAAPSESPTTLTVPTEGKLQANIQLPLESEGEQPDMEIKLPPEVQQAFAKIVKDAQYASHAANEASAPPPMPEPVEVAAVETHQPNMQALEQPATAEVVAAAPTMSAPMMSSQDRRRELYKLAQDMELMFVERNGQ